MQKTLFKGYYISCYVILPQFPSGVFNLVFLLISFFICLPVTSSVLPWSFTFFLSHFRLLFLFLSLCVHYSIYLSLFLSLSLLLFTSLSFPLSVYFSLFPSDSIFLSISVSLSHPLRRLLKTKSQLKSRIL